MYCPRCKDEFSSFQSICPNCFGDLAPSGIREPSLMDGLATLLDGGIVMPTTHLSDPGSLDLSASILLEYADTALDAPLAEARSGVLQAGARVQEGGQAVSQAVNLAVQEMRQGEAASVAVAQARGRLMDVMDTTGRDLQRMAHSTREAVLRELKREAANSREKAANLLHQRQLEIGEEMSRRMHDLANQFVRLKSNLDQADQQSIQSRLDNLEQQASSVLVGLQKEVGLGGRGLPDQVRNLVRQAGGDPEKMQAQVQNVVESAGESAENVQKGCLGAGTAVASFILPGLGHLIMGQTGPAFGLFLLWTVVTASISDETGSTLANLFIRGLSAWAAWTAAQSR